MVFAQNDSKQKAIASEEDQTTTRLASWMSTPAKGLPPPSLKFARSGFWPDWGANQLAICFCGDTWRHRPV